MGSGQGFRAEGDVRRGLVAGEPFADPLLDRGFIKVLRDHDRFTYFTGNHEPSREQAEAILDWFALHEQSETGEVSFRQWPDRMRGHFIARIPKAPA